MRGESGGPRVAPEPPPRVLVVGSDAVPGPKLDSFGAALAAATGGAVHRENALPARPPDAPTWLVVCTGPVAAPELEWIAAHWGREPAQRTVALGLTLRGAAEALARFGGPAAIERRGYAAWVRDAPPLGRRSGLVCRARDAERYGLPVRVAMETLVATADDPPLPRQLAFLLSAAGTR